MENVCRSPMAEGLLKEALSAYGKEDFNISSVGLGACVDYPPDPHACQLLLKKNIDISDYRARQLTKDMIRNADIILVMESSHKTTIEKLDHCAKGKVFRLGHWGNFDIPDPYRKNISAFIASLNLIERGISDWLHRL